MGQKLSYSKALHPIAVYEQLIYGREQVSRFFFYRLFCQNILRCGIFAGIDFVENSKIFSSKYITLLTYVKGFVAEMKAPLTPNSCCSLAWTVFYVILSQIVALTSSVGYMKYF